MTLVLCNGVFDLLHVGHIRHLEEARKMGDYLVVSVTMDDCVGKGRGRPIETCEERMEKLRSMRCVSAVSMCKDAVQALEQWKPDVFVKGHDYMAKGLRKDELAYCKAHKVRIVHTKPSRHSTGKLIERIKQCA